MKLFNYDVLLEALRDNQPAMQSAALELAAVSMDGLWDRPNLLNEIIKEIQRLSRAPHVKEAAQDCLSQMKPVLAARSLSIKPDAADAIRLLIDLKLCDLHVSDILAAELPKIVAMCDSEDPSHGGINHWQVWGSWVDASRRYLRFCAERSTEHA